MSVFTFFFNVFPLQNSIVYAEGNANQYAAEEKPEITSDYAYLIDLDTGQVLYEKGSSDRIYPASMTKMMTTILAIENLPDTSMTVTVTEEMLAGLKEASASRAGFDVGDEPTVLDLLYGDILPSGADCSRALSFTIAGSEEAYVDLMNAKAEELGMTGTHFVNTTGLHDDNHYSTLQDIATLMKYCLQNELFRTIISTETYTSVPVKSQPDGLLMNSVVLKYINHPENEYNWNIEGFIGGKSGFTLEGEYCLASIASFSGMNLMLITAHGWINRYYPVNVEDASILYGYMNEHYQRQTLYTADETVSEIPVRNSMDESLSVYADSDLVLDVPNDDNLHIELNIPDTISSNTSKDENVGTANVYSYDSLVGTVTLKAEKEVKITFLGTLKTVVKEHPTAVLSILGILLIVLIILYVQAKKAQRRRKRKKRRA